MPAGKCWADSDCGADQYCKRDTTTCTAKEIAGAPIPSDGLHDGTCTTANAAATCVTGLCNDTTNTCAAAASSACTKPAQCAAGVCGRDGACGIPGGEFCESSAQCRSGTCADGLCTIPGAKIESRGLVECAVGDATPSGGAPSPWAFLAVGAAVLLRRRRGAGDETTTN
jgi:MYXO-CTERM domain-containing protein